MCIYIYGVFINVYAVCTRTLHTRTYRGVRECFVLLYILCAVARNFCGERFKLHHEGFNEIMFIFYMKYENSRSRAALTTALYGECERIWWMSHAQKSQSTKHQFESFSRCNNNINVHIHIGNIMMILVMCKYDISAFE